MSIYLWNMTFRAGTREFYEKNMKKYIEKGDRKNETINQFFL